MKTSCQERARPRCQHFERWAKEKEARATHEFVEAPQRATDRFPHGEQQADGRERLFATRQTLRVLLLGLFRTRIGLGLDEDVEGAVRVVELELAGKATLREVVLEHGPRAVADVRAEVGPAHDARVVRRGQRLVEAVEGS